MKKSNFISNFFRKVCKLSLSDRFLLIFMTLLFAHIFINLFYHEMAGNKSAAIDVAARTTMSAIFGYFIGGGFIKSGNDTPIEPKKDLYEADEAYPIEEGNDNGEQPERYKQQITIVATIGILSLLALIVVEYSTEILPSEAMATLSQLRDFVTGSVGLLIGYSNKKS